MKLKFEQFKLLVKEELALKLAVVLSEADEKENVKAKAKAAVENYKERWEEIGKSFNCPRHNLPLLTKWTMISSNQSYKNEEKDEHLKGVYAFGNMIPPTNKYRGDVARLYPKLLLKQKFEFKYVPECFYCPKREEAPTKEDTESLVKKIQNHDRSQGWTDEDDNDGELEDAFSVVVYVDRKDKDGNVVINPETKKPFKDRAEVIRKCDYVVSGKWQKPGMISRNQWLEQETPYMAWGEVAEELEAEGKLDRRNPKRSKDFMKKQAEVETAKGAPEPLLNKINDMIKNEYHYVYVRPAGAVDLIKDKISDEKIQGIRNVGLSRDAKKIQIQTVLPFERIKTIADDAGKSQNQTTLQKQVLDIFNGLIDLRDKNSTGIPIEFVDELAKGADPTSAEYFANLQKKGKGNLIKTKLEKTADGSPIFTSDDVWYLTGDFAHSLRVAKQKVEMTGQKYSGPEPYYGIKRNNVERLLQNLGWKMKGHEEDAGLEAKPGPTDVKWVPPNSSKKSYTSFDDIKNDAISDEYDDEVLKDDDEEDLKKAMKYADELKSKLDIALNARKRLNVRKSEDRHSIRHDEDIKQADDEIRMLRSLLVRAQADVEDYTDLDKESKMRKFIDYLKKDKATVDIRAAIDKDMPKGRK